MTIEATRQEWAEMRADSKHVKQAVDTLTTTVGSLDRTVTKFLEREKAHDAALIRAQQTADDATRVAYEAKAEAKEAKMMVTSTSSNVDRWQDWAFKISAALIVAGVAGMIGYMVAA